MKFRRQRGMTALGMLILIAFVGVFVFGGIRLMPIYLEHMKIASAMDGIQSEFDGQGATRATISNSLQKRFDIESVRVITLKDIKIKKENNGYTVNAEYQNSTPFVANVSFTVTFNKQVVIRN